VLLFLQVLADGICQQKALYELIIPLHQQWLLHASADRVHERWLTDCPSSSCSLSRLDCSTLLGLVVNCNPMLAAICQVSAATV
jgi:hypothetical protein